MLGCLIFVFSCIVANVTSVILFTRSVEKKKNTKNTDVKRNNETSDDIERNGTEAVRELFDLTGIIERIEMSHKNVKSVRKDRKDYQKFGCFAESAGSKASKHEHLGRVVLPFLFMVFNMVYWPFIIRSYYDGHSGAMRLDRGS